RNFNDEDFERNNVEDDAEQEEEEDGQEEEDEEEQPPPELLPELLEWESAAKEVFSNRRLPASVWPAFLVGRLAVTVNQLPQYVAVHYAWRVQRQLAPLAEDNPAGHLADLILIELRLSNMSVAADCYLMSFSAVSIKQHLATRPLSLCLSACAVLRAGYILGGGGLLRGCSDSEMAAKRLEEAIHLAAALSGSVSSALSSALAMLTGKRSSPGGQPATDSPLNALRYLESDCVPLLRRAALRQICPAELVGESGYADLTNAGGLSTLMKVGSAEHTANHADCSTATGRARGTSIGTGNCGGAESWGQLVSLGDYQLRVLREIGRGGFGTVSLDTRLDGEGSIEEQKELKYLQLLKDSGKVVKLFAHEIRNNRLLLLIEYGDCDFAKFLSANPGLPLSGVAFYWEQMLLCVQAMHSVGCVHMDLKPANFVLCRGLPKLIDLGAAHVLDQSVTSDMLKNEVHATLGFMAPETIVWSPDEKPIFSRKSDVWSLGCILYLMLWGSTPFAHLKDFPSLAYQLRHGRDPVPLPDWLPRHRSDTGRRQRDAKKKGVPGGSKADRKQRKATAAGRRQLLGGCLDRAAAASGSRHPSHLRGRDIGLFYANRQREKRQFEDIFHAPELIQLSDSTAVRLQQLLGVATDAGVASGGVSGDTGLSAMSVDEAVACRSANYKALKPNAQLDAKLMKELQLREKRISPAIAECRQRLPVWQARERLVAAVNRCDQLQYLGSFFNNNFSAIARCLVLFLGRLDREVHPDVAAAELTQPLATGHGSTARVVWSPSQGAWRHRASRLWHIYIATLMHCLPNLTNSSVKGSSGAQDAASACGLNRVTAPLAFCSGDWSGTDAVTAPASAI
uniref:Protein kinase domain-containing protein n=1 Tax=Macrostomum lignano TaxID=282301 RepID=A0A1I8F3P3_9PLAT